MSVTVTVNGQSGPTISAKSGDQVGVTVGGSGAYAVSVSQAGTPGGQGQQGPQGPPSTTITVGKVETLSPGANATVTSSSSNSGANLTLNFGLPAGQTGANGAAGTTPAFAIGKVSTLAAGSSANVTLTTANSGANVTLDFGIPAGADGNGSASLSNATPSNLGTSSAGTSNLAARADHVHAVPTIAYSSLAGVPSNFPTNATLVSGLSSATVSSVNNLTGALTLAAGANVTLTTNGSTMTLSSSAGGLGANDAVDGGFYEGYTPANTITITTQPTNQTASGGAATFAAAATVSPSGTPAYQWQVSLDAGSTWANISGATSSTLSLTGLTSSDNGKRYRVVVSATGAAGVTSNAATLTAYANTWSLVGSPIASPSGGWLGHSLAISDTGTVVAAGDPDFGQLDTGLVRTFAWTGSAWVQRGGDFVGTENQLLGYDVSLSASGGVLAIASANIEGIAVHEWSGSSWSARGSAIGVPGVASISLSNDGTQLAIGYSGYDRPSPAAANIGRAQVYQWSGGQWSQLGADLIGEGSFDGFGAAVALSGDGSSLAVASTRGDAVANAGAGDVRVFVWSGSAWVQRGADIDGESAGDATASGNVSTSVALSIDGGVLAIGTVANDGAGDSAGSVRVFAWDGSSWVRRGADIDGQEASDFSGAFVSLSDNGALVAIASLSGPARVFAWDGSTWTQRGGGLGGGGRRACLSASGSVVALQDQPSGAVSIHQWT